MLKLDKVGTRVETRMKMAEIEYKIYDYTTYFNTEEWE